MSKLNAVPKIEAARANQESDMRVYKNDGKYEERVFAQYPLLGSKIIPPETLNKLHDNAKNYIDTILREPWSELTLRAEMQITLSLINHAKNWNIENNNSFWNYIVLQYGYRDANGAVVRILQNAMEDALKKNKRLFVEDSNGRGFKSTAVIHALSTRKSWMALFDFLFDFYKNNLNWKLLQDDPLLDIMIKELQHKLSGDDAEDVELTISSQVYSFQEGIRKLILLRPIYTKGLFERLLHKIDDLINSVNKPVRTYEEQLCEEWFKDKLLSIANSKKKDRQDLIIQREIVIDYSRIRVKYVLKNENSIQIVLPDIRLKTENFSGVFLNISYDGMMVYHRPMSWYGNELGKTLNGVAVPLPDYKNGKDKLSIQVSITCDDEEIYNSGDELYRKAIVFSDKHEVGIDKIKCGNYSFIIPSNTVLECENVVLTEIDSIKQFGVKGYFAELNEGYAIILNGALISFDNENSKGIRVISPMEKEEFPEFTKNDINYHFVYKNGICNIIIPDTEPSGKYKLLCNKKQIDLDALKISLANQENIYALPINDEEFCQIQIIDLETERLVYDRGFVAISHLDCCFNRDFYFSQNDYVDSKYEILGDGICETIHFPFEDDEITVPYRGGFIRQRIPKVQIIETTGTWMNDVGRPAWYIGDVPQNSMFKVLIPPETKARFMVGGTDIEYDNQGIVSIGNILQSLYAVCGLPEIKVEVELSRKQTTQKYLLATVFCREGFIKKPGFWFHEGRLYWDRGNMFIGKANRKFTLTLLGEMGDALDFEIDGETEYVMLPDQINFGNYRFEVSILSGGLFRKTKEIIAQGVCVIGDENVLRFKNRRIVINTITDESYEEAGHIKIKTCYIDQLEFKGIQETSEGICPVYAGTMYTDGYQGERHEFSFSSHTTDLGVKKIMINPVRIVYIGGKTLCITDSEGDGLYYYNYYDKHLGTKVFEITDHEYTEKNRKRYSTADLYSYRTERI